MRAPRAFAAMGTVVSVRPGTANRRSDAADGADDPAPAVAAVFSRWESRCSGFIPTSELSRIVRGELALADAGEEVRRAYEVAAEWRVRTDGAFSPHRPDGRIDLDGVVKALAIAEAGAALRSGGRDGWAIDAGGDVLVAKTRDGREWEVGIVDPSDRGSMVAAVRLGRRRRAVATSGSAERGDHIWTRAGAGPSPYLQVSVAAGDILTADVIATAIVSGGRVALDDCTDRFDVDVLAVERDGALLATPGWPRAAAG